jgi:E3 ubiquitin-protein ligase MARCH6
MATDDAASATARLLDDAHDIAIEAKDASAAYDDHVPRPKTADKDDADTCRICRGEGSVDEPLFYPCKCSGSIKYVHQECLMEWLSHTQKKHCELCKTSFRFTKLYHPTMPTRIPTTVFIRRAAMHVVNMFLTWCRAVLVTCVWLLVLPWCMRVVWRSLFWVGDGGWSHDMYLESTETGETSKLTPFNITLRPSPERINLVAANNSRALSNSFFSLPFASYNASAPELAVWTFAKRLLFGFPLPLASLSTPEVNQTAINATSDPLGIRSPSLLSDVPFFNWFDSQTANRFIIDVLEGQIITLLVVVAFILIFLIREWVVQQQPVINMVALGDNAAAHRAVDHEVEAQHDPAEGEDDEEEHEEDHDAEDGDVDGIEAAQAAHYEAIPTTDEALAPRAPNPLADSPYILAHDARGAAREAGASSMQSVGSDGASLPAQSQIPPQSTDATDDTADLESSESSQRPLMPERDRSFMATGIRRGLEEGNDWSFENIPQTLHPGAVGTSNVPNSWDDEDAEDVEGQDSEHSGESWQQVADVVADTDSDQVLEGDRSRDMGKSAAPDDIGSLLPKSDVREHEDPNATTMDPASDIDYSSTKSQQGSEASFDFSGSEEDSLVPEQPTAGPASQETSEPRAEAVLHPQPPPSVIDRALDWMFGDVARTVPAAEEPGNEEHIVRNLADEAPFVPFAGNEPQAPADPPAQDPEVAAAAAQAGIDVNDQEAIEDAEDLEGILELIGMQGPIVGLFQNVLFSAVLISATLACAVWLPYLWGKIVILFMGSPIALLVKLPLQLIATLTDLIVDLALVVMAGVTYWGSQLISTVVHFCAKGNFPQLIDGRLASMSAAMRTLAEGAMDRIAKVFVQSPLSPRPDYFRLSVNSHMALRALQNSTSTALNETNSFANAFMEQASSDSPFRFLWRSVSGLPYVLQAGVTWLYTHIGNVVSWIWASKSYKITLDLDLGHNAAADYTSVERWTASDRMIAIFAGYAFFAVAGAVYLKRGSPFSTSQQGQRIERIISDVLGQAGGVLKVILIISIEMLAFPLYCGLLLDLAMLPLFKNATLYTRWQFACSSPWTSGFVHWFIGTCYMFHFALFVSMCRKIMRKGVLYFIRDPDDPTFHPVRDVLERSVTTQLRKIAFSALVYGALVIICLGGVVWTLSRATSGVLPIHWTTEAPSLEFPLDLLFYNFLTPVIIKAYKPSESIHALYKWCFMKCARLLRLNSFLFGGQIAFGAPKAGRYVRAPASDQARIPKGQPVFIDVDEKNVRKDGVTVGGVHNSDLVTMVYIPNWFRVRIFAFVITIWFLMGMSGVGVTILPMLLGRFLFSLVLPDTVDMNDIHAFSLGVYTLGSIAYSGFHAYKFICSLNRPVPSPLATLQNVATTTSRIGLRVLRFTYVWLGLVFAIPLAFAILIELYFLMPLHAYLGPAEPHVVHLIQDWTLGFLYSRIAARMLFANRQSRPARAFNAVIADGYLYPNARIATRCFLLPITALWLIAIAVPSSLAFTTSYTLYSGASEQTRNMVWRFSFPAVGLSIVAMWASKEAVRMLTRWRLVVRDEVYLIGERLHNFGERRAGMQSRATEEAISAAGMEVR